MSNTEYLKGTITEIKNKDNLPLLEFLRKELSEIWGEDYSMSSLEALMEIIEDDSELILVENRLFDITSKALLDELIIYKEELIEFNLLVNFSSEDLKKDYLEEAILEAIEQNKFK